MKERGDNLNPKQMKESSISGNQWNRKPKKLRKKVYQTKSCVFENINETDESVTPG